MDIKIIRLADEPQRADEVARWFHEKWEIPLEEYQKSIEQCLKKKDSVPQWYLAVEQEKIIGGLGVIENDFHMRKDLAPNICAVYVEEEKRCRGIAGALLSFVCDDMKKRGIKTLYLVTDHTSFYERYGWKFLGMVQEEGAAGMIRMYVHEGEE